MGLILRRLPVTQAFTITESPIDFRHLWRFSHSTELLAFLAPCTIGQIEPPLENCRVRGREQESDDGRWIRGLDGAAGNSSSCDRQSSRAVARTFALGNRR